MNFERRRLTSFVVIGKEGSTDDGEGFVGRLWEDANAHFGEVAHLAQKDENGDLCGIWGAMSDMSRSFMPWGNNFTRGLYLAGVQCIPEAEAPAGWTKWVIPAYEFLCVESCEPDVFVRMIQYLEQQHMPLVGAVQDYTCPKTGRNYMYFPVVKR